MNRAIWPTGILGLPRFFPLEVKKMRGHKQCDIRIICKKADASDITAALIEGMKRENYRPIKCSDPKSSRKDNNDVLVYLEFFGTIRMTLESMICGERYSICGLNANLPIIKK